jgi:GntR family transcriptional repressor for pyruvate dehydrogenase complex
LDIDARLPSEAELSELFKIGRSTVQEALKRLAAQSLIRTEQGAWGGAFIKRLKYEDAYEQQITTSTLLLSMNAVSFETACEARFTLERAYTPYAAERRSDLHITNMRKEINSQSLNALSNEDFCASDIRLHRILVDSANNPILSYQLAGAIEAMQPLMNMITFSARSREKIVRLHSEITNSLEKKSSLETNNKLSELEDYTKSLAKNVLKTHKNLKKIGMSLV